MLESISWLFVVTSLILIITPGQDMMLVMSRSIAQGSRAGVVTAAGVSTGLLGHSLLAALGLGAVLMASEMVFMAIKYAGAAYLIYLGIGALLHRHGGLTFRQLAAVPVSRLFFQGALSNISNPKITIFYFAYLPQFIPAGSPHPTAKSIKVPVAYDASSDSSQMIAFATSSGCPPRFIGRDSFMRSTRPGSPPSACISVYINPGRTALTRIPSSATSLDKPIVRVSIAPFDAA